jgi:hypothetical protein
MRLGTICSAFTLAALCCAVAPRTANTQTAGNEAVFLQSGQTASLDCAGGKAGVTGSNNVLTFTGKCTDLELAGSGNKISIQFGPGARIEFVGSDNAVTWTSTDGKPPRMESIATGNTLTPPMR